MSALSTVSLMTAVESSENLNLEFTSNLNYDYLFDQNHLTCLLQEKMQVKDSKMLTTISFKVLHSQLNFSSTLRDKLTEILDIRICYAA